MTTQQLTIHSPDGDKTVHEPARDKDGKQIQPRECARDGEEWPCASYRFYAHKPRRTRRA